MLDNRIQIYLNQDGSLRNANIDPVYKLSNQTVIVELRAPFANNTAVYVKFLLSNSAQSELRAMQLMTDITELVDGETYRVWQYRLPSSILSAASKTQAQSFFVSFFTQDLDLVSDSDYRFNGFYDTLTDLQMAIPTPSSSQPQDYAGVGPTLAATEATLYLGVATGNAVNWVEQTGQTLQDFIDANNIEDISRTRSTTSVKVAIGASVGSDQVEIVDINQTTIINNRISGLEAAVADLQASYVRKDLDEYADVGVLEPEDQLFLNFEGSTEGRITNIGQIADYVRDDHDDSPVELQANKGQIGGYAPLTDQDGQPKIPSEYLPDDVIQFKGTFGSAQSTTGGDLPANAGVGDTYLCDVEAPNSYFSAVANETFFQQDEAIWDGTAWKKVGGVGSVKEAPLDFPDVIYGRRNGQWADVRDVIAPFLYKRDVTITQANTTVINVGLSEFEAEDSVFVYEDGLLLIEGINYAFNSTTGDITFLSEGQPGDPGYNIPEVGSIITIQLIKKAVFSGFVGSASGVSFDPQQINIIDATNVQLAIQQLVAGVYTQEQLQNDGQAEVSGRNVQGIGVQKTIIDNLEELTWKGTLAAESSLAGIVNPSAGDVYAVLQEQTLFIYRNDEWVQILASGQVPQDGVDGADAVFGLLSRPAAVLTQDANFDLIYTNSGSEIRVYEGSTLLTPSTVPGDPAAGKYVVSLSSATNITAGALTNDPTNTFVILQDHSSLSNILLPASVILTVSGKRTNGDAFSFPITQTIGVAIRGANGEDGADGADGADGSDGTSFTPKGSVSTFNDLALILNPQPGDVYFVDDETTFYAYDGASWIVFPIPQGPAGADGADGTNGVDGTDGVNFAVIRLYRRTDSNTAPTAPSNVSGEYNFTTAVVSNLAGNLNSFTLAIPELTDPADRYLWESSFSLSTADNPATFSGITSSTPKIISVNGTDGQNGDPGPEGPQGPGIVYRGVWDTNKTYFRTATRADVVLENGVYYLALQQSQSINPTNTAYWAVFQNQFDMVATNILLTDNATITKGLVIGQDGTDQGFIRSTTSSAINSGTGFYLNNQGELSLGSTAGNNGLYWNGTILDIKGDLGGTLGSIVVDNLTIDSSGIDVTVSNDLKFSIDANTGDAFFKGTIEAGSGQIGGATFGSTTIGGQGAALLSRLEVDNDLVAGGLVVGGLSVQRDIRPNADNQFDLGFVDPQTDLYWRNIYLRNNPIVVSDETKKENIAPVGNEYNDIILNTEIITYNNPNDDKLKIGIGARQFVEQFGDNAKLVIPRADEGIFSADYVAFVPMLIKTIQSLEARIKELEKQEV